MINRDDNGSSGGNSESSAPSLNTQITTDLFSELNERAAQAHTVKSAFLANMSHEMRTPLTVILGFADILKRPALPDELRSDYLNRIERSGQQLLGLIEDLLDLSKIEAGQMTLRQEDTNVRQIVRQVLEKYSAEATSKNLELEATVEPGVPMTIASSPLRLRQVLNNLVSNAVKFTEQGGVQIRIRSSHLATAVSIDVIDTGIGMTQAQQDELFQPFMQADNSRTGGKGGTGIGLILSQRLTELLGGELTLKHSLVGVGTTFSVSLPGISESKMTTDSKTGAKLPPMALAGKNILIAEDVADNQDLFRIVLESAGARVDIVGNGEEAVKKAFEDKFDAILMDVQMPVLDGLSATRKIRAQGATLPIIALTAHAMPEEVAKSKAAGCDDHVSKPITAKILIAALLKLLGDGQS